MTALGRNYLTSAVVAMEQRGVGFAAGLSSAEVEAAEAAHGFRFPPELREFLMHALPTGPRFPNWREPSSEYVRESLSWPAEGICFDVEHSAFWLPDWGERPSVLEQARARAREAVREAPFLITLCGHRYLPASPAGAGNPVFSVVQTDIIHYGFDFPSYLHEEFGVPNPFPTPNAPREIAFWSHLVDCNV